MKRLLVIVGMAAVIGGGLYYYFAIHGPARDRRLAHEEIERWEKWVLEVHACLLGPGMITTTLGEALAIHELTTTDIDFKPCRSKVAQLARGFPATQIAEVEAAWRNTEAAAVDLGYRLSVFFLSNDRSNELQQLGESLDRLDDRHRELRKAAGMAPRAAPAPLVAATLIPLGTGQVESISEALRPSAGGVVVMVEPNHQFVLVPGKPPRSARSDNALPSVTVGTFAAQGGDGQIAFHGGNVGEPMRTAKLWSADLSSEVLFTLGGPSDAVVGYFVKASRPYQVALARLTETAIDLGTPADADYIEHAIDPPNRALLAWSFRGAMRASIVTPGTPTKIVDLGMGDPNAACLSTIFAWVSTGDGPDSDQQRVRSLGHEDGW